MHGGLETVSAVLPLTDPRVALICVVPLASAVASPELLIVATEFADEDQLTVVVASLVLPSL